MVFTADPDTGALNLSFDEAKIDSELPVTLNQDLASPPVARKVLTRPDGKAPIVAEAGSDGTAVADPTPVVAAVKAALNAAQPLQQSVDMVDVEHATEETPVPQNFDVPNGDKWIDVNLSTFKVTLMQGTTAGQQFTVVTGKGGLTRTGRNYVYMKIRSQTMESDPSVPESSPDYYSLDNVQWVSYFDGGIAFHGAYWRSSFGYADSHGCINMPNSQAQIVYDWAPLGTMADVHY
jgi:lipoprotein-anchoring transpeptidase ErfK/SrfK